MRQQRLNGFGFAIGLLVSLAGTAPAQDDHPSLRLDGLVPGGARSSLTDAWAPLRFTIVNRHPTAREARVVVFYLDRPDVQYCREVWVPAQAQLTSWLPVGPPPTQGNSARRDIGYRLYERIDGTFQPVATREPERLVSRVELYRPREPSTAISVDAGDRDDPESLTAKDSAAAQSVLLARTFRHSRGLSEPVSIVPDRHLPATPEAFDGIDQFILASNQLAVNPAAGQALRHWVLQGGTLWVLLDRVNPDILAPILGEGLRFQIVGRTSLTTLKLRRPTEEVAFGETREFDQPVDLVRVVLSGSEAVLFEANGWPAAFSQTVGRGRVVFTTLDGRAWHRPRLPPPNPQSRSPGDPPSRYPFIPDLPVAVNALDGLAMRIYPDPQPEALRSEDLAPLLRAEIGYEIMSRGTATVLLVGFVLGVVALGVWLRRSRAPERIGLFGPVLAVVATGAFVVIGVTSRHAVPSTAAAVSVVEIAPENGEAAWRGLFAVYNPASGTLQLGTEHGGAVDLDSTGLEGQTRQRVQTDLGAWHWENLAFPAGVRMGSFQTTNRTGVSAKGRFGPRGLEGRLTTGTFRNPVDAVVLTSSGTAVTVRVEADGSFRATSDDILPAGQYLPGAVLTDRQQRRQDVYRLLLSRPNVSDHRDRLYVWVETEDVPFTVTGATRVVGMALLVIPIEYEYQRGAEPITIPDGFIPFVSLDRNPRPTLESSEPVQMRLRFQLPPSVHPLTLDRAILTARVRAPGRKFSVSGSAEGKAVPLFEELGPERLIRVEITDPRVLRADPTGGLFLEYAVGPRLGPDGRPEPVRMNETVVKWQIEALGLEVVGRPGANR